MLYGCVAPSFKARTAHASPCDAASGSGTARSHLSERVGMAVVHQIKAAVHVDSNGSLLCKRGTGL